ncbi:monocarboxylate transporter 7-like [Contarinia nasturtii]|uniref:monocarboxylate transporter 7-like n=1 Tax=Contarinia nasturtii TaxID=265458 RepID=UPI0012D45229|nr:monocarboxylate transporter 7-like [Contarinia nasturtii]
MKGGWGLLIPFGVAMVAAFHIGSFASFGLLFDDFLKNLGAETKAVTIISGSNSIMLSFGGLFASILFKKFSMRSVGLIGATIFFAGSLLTAFATSVEHLVIFFGIMEGMGTGLMSIVAYTTFNHYFVRRRVFIMSITQTLKGVIIMLYPIMVQFLMDKYGFRGAAALIAVIHAHIFFGMAVMHPIEWHYKVVKIPLNDEKPLLNIANQEEIVKVTVTDGEKKLCVDIEHVPTFNQDENGNERIGSLDTTQPTDFDLIKRRISSIISLGDLMGESYGRVKNGKWQKIVDFLDLNLFKDPIYVNIAIGVTFVTLSDNAFFTLLPMYLFELGFDKADTAKLVSLSAAADLGSRAFMALIALCIQIKARHVTLIGAIVTILFRFVFLNVHSFIGMVVIIIVLGFFRTWLHVTVPLIFADHLPPSQFASGYGLYMFLYGNFSFIISPFIGYIRDMTKSYVTCFNSLSFIMSLCVIPWILEMIWFRLYSRKRKIVAQSIF